MAEQSVAALLGALLAAWKTSPHPRLADAIDRLTGKLEPRPALAATKRQADLDAWAQVERAHDPLDFPRLLAAARGGQQADVSRQLTALARWKDPRFAMGLLALLERPPYAGVKSRPLLRTIFELLLASGDVRAAAPARALAARYLGIVSSSTGGFVVTALQGVAAQLEALAPGQLTVPAEELCVEAERLAPLTAKPPPPVPNLEARITELLELVYAAPDDDRPRAVLADALLEAGDARGEFIRAQLAGSPIDPTLRKEPAVAAWMQPLRMAGDCFFARGFPDSIALYKTAAKSKDERSWRTVRSVRDVHKLSNKGAAELLNSPNLEHVRHVATLTAAQLKALGQAPRKWTSLGLELLEQPQPTAFAPFPELKTLSVSVEGPVDPALFAAIPKLEELKLRSDTPGAFAPDALAPLPLRRLELTVSGRLDALRLPASLERAALFGDFTRVHFDAPRLVRLRCASSALRGAVIPSLRELELFVGENDAHTLEGASAVTHLQLRGEKHALDPRLLAPLKRLQSLRVLPPTPLGGAHLAGLDALVHLSGFTYAVLGEVPALSSLVSFECMAPRDLELLGPLLSKNPQLEHLGLHWNSGCPLYFHGHDFHARARAAWERLRALLEASAVRTLDFHDQLTLVRDDQGWSRVIIRGADESGELGQLLKALRSVFPFSPQEA